MLAKIETSNEGPLATEMQLTLSVFVSVEREEGRSVYACRPLRGPYATTRDVLLSSALSKLGNRMRKTINEWVRNGKAHRVDPWLYDPALQASKHKLTLLLPDRTLRWKLLLVTLPAFDRMLAFSPNVPDVVFELENRSLLEPRAVEVYSKWARHRIQENEDLGDVQPAGDMWVEPLTLEVDTAVQTKKSRENIFAALFGGEKMSGSEELHNVGQCLDDQVQDFASVIGRDALIDEVDRVLQRDDRQGVLVVGQPSVGKTAIIRECARRRHERYKNSKGHRPQTWWLSPQRLVSGMSYLGQWEQRLLAILKESTKRDHVLYLDDLVGLFSAGRTRDSSLCAADVLQSYLAESQVRILGETTETQLALLRRKDRALADRFHIVNVPTLSDEDSLPLVLESMYQLETSKKIFFHPKCVPLVMRHQEVFAPDRAFPGKAIELLHTLAKHNQDFVTPGSLYHQAIAQVGANLNLLLGRLGTQTQIQEALQQQLVGQPAAVAALSKVAIRFAQQVQPTDRPLGVLLFLGPTGVGKTEAAKAITRLLYEQDSRLLRFDMNEITNPIAAEQLIGSFDEPEGRLTSAVRRQPNCVILFDEIEKAHPDVFDYLLQVIGEGRLTDARGRIADFRSSIIVMTSNLGASESAHSLGFGGLSKQRQQIYEKAAAAFFRPEFINRIDETVVFDPLTAKDMEHIVRLQMNAILSRDGIRRRDIYVQVSPAAIDQVIQTGFDSQFGARSVRRTLERDVIGRLGDCLSELELSDPALVEIKPAADAANASLENRPTAGSRKLETSVTRLITETPKQLSVLCDLDSIARAGQQLCEKWTEQLADIRGELEEADQQAGEKTPQVSYYALREQIHRAADVVKAVSNRLEDDQARKIDVAASDIESKRPHKETGWETAGSNRRLKNLASHFELISVYQDAQAANSSQGSSEEMAKEAIRTFSLTNCLLDAALKPRHWLVWFARLDRPHNSADPTATKPFSDAADSYLETSIRCLNLLQYETKELSNVSEYCYSVAGTGISGLLEPLLGMYRIQNGGNNPPTLRILRVQAVSPIAEDDELAKAFLGCQTSSLTATIGQRENQIVRGEIGIRTCAHYASGTKLNHKHKHLFEPQQMVLNQMHYWLDCLPIPPELIE